MNIKSDMYLLYPINITVEVLIIKINRSTPIMEIVNTKINIKCLIHIRRDRILDISSSINKMDSSSMDTLEMLKMLNEVGKKEIAKMVDLVDQMDLVYLGNMVDIMNMMDMVDLMDQVDIMELVDMVDIKDMMDLVDFTDLVDMMELVDLVNMVNMVVRV